MLRCRPQALNSRPRQARRGYGQVQLTSHVSSCADTGDAGGSGAHCMPTTHSRSCTWVDLVEGRGPTHHLRKSPNHRLRWEHDDLTTFIPSTRSTRDCSLCLLEVLLKSPSASLALSALEFNHQHVIYQPDEDIAKWSKKILPSATVWSEANDVMSDKLESFARASTNCKFVLVVDARDHTEGAMQIFQLLCDTFANTGATVIFASIRTSIQAFDWGSLEHCKCGARPYCLENGDFSPVQEQSIYWLKGMLSWPQNTRCERDESDITCVKPAAEWTHRISLTGALMPQWVRAAARDSCDLQLKEVCAPWTTILRHVIPHIERPGANQQRTFHASEIEAALGLPSGLTSNFDKDKAGAIQDHQAKRKRLLRSSMSVFVLAFLLSATLGDASEQAGLQPWDFVPNLEVPPDELQALNLAKSECGYLRDRVERGLPIACPMGPDSVELNAHSPNCLAEGAQSRRSAGANVPFKAVPAGLTPEEHYYAALDIESPLFVETPLPDDLDYAVRTIVSKGAATEDWRRVQMDRHRMTSRKCSKLGLALDAQRGSNSSRCASHFRHLNFAIVAYAIGWADWSLVEMLTKGANPLGEQQVFGIYRKRKKIAKCSIDQMLQDSCQFVSSLPQDGRWRRLFGKQP